MHSYSHNIKTFNHATRHLTRVERSLYRDLIELYYDTEQPLSAVDFDDLARDVMARTDEEIEALKYVLRKFFVKTGDVYTHDYCDEQIEKYHSTGSAKAKAGRASAEARKKKAAARKQQRQAEGEQNLTGVEQVLNGCATNQEPITNNQNKKEKVKKKKPPTKTLVLPDHIPKEKWEAYLSSRKSKKHPMNVESLQLAVESINKTMQAGHSVDDIMTTLIETGWRTAKAAWMENRKNSEMADEKHSNFSAQGGTATNGYEEPVEDFEARLQRTLGQTIENDPHTIEGDFYSVEASTH